MTLINWIAIYIADIMFWIWVYFVGGAEMLGNTFISGIFIFLVTLKWRQLNSEGIKLFGGLIVIMHTFFFILGIAFPPVRSFFGL